jgi:hypothetical protein
VEDCKWITSDLFTHTVHVDEIMLIHSKFDPFLMGFFVGRKGDEKEQTTPTLKRQ